MTRTEFDPSVVGVKPEAENTPTAPLRALPVLLLIAGALVFGAVDGYLAYITESPGTSLAGHCLLVASIAVVVAAVGWRLLRSKNHKIRLVFAVSFLAAGFLATWWAWSFAMPAAMSWDSSATPRALGALKGIGVDRSVCVNVTSGSIGPLHAPYRQCAVIGGTGSLVEFTAQSQGNKADVSPYRGLIFSDQPESTFSDECTRHLVGEWYAYTADPSGMTGYTCHQGP